MFFRTVIVNFCFPSIIFAESSQHAPHPADTSLRPYSLLYLMPARLCVDAVALDFAALCVSPPVEGGGLRSIDHRIEPFVLPTNHVEHSGYILSTFEKKVCNMLSVVFVFLAFQFFWQIMWSALSILQVTDLLL